jgi:hypothetical protein
MANNMEKKITKALNYGAIIKHLEALPAGTILDTVTVGSGENAKSVPITVELAIEKLTHEIGLLEKKNSGSGSGKPTKSQEANIALEAEILEFMADSPNQLFTTTDIIKSCSACEGMNPQKVAPRLNAMEKEGKVSKTKDKGKTLWQYVSGGDVEDWDEEDYED